MILNNINNINNINNDYSFYRILKELVQLLSPTVNYCHACKGLCQSIGATQSRLLPCALEISQFSKKN